MTEDVFEALVAGAKEPELQDNVQAVEETILAALFGSDPEAVARIVAETRPTDFYYSEYRRLALYTYPRKRDGKGVDLVTLKEDVEAEGVDNWEKIEKVAGDIIAKAEEKPPQLGTVLSYLDIFTAWAKQRAAMTTIETARRELEAGDKSPEVAAAQVFAAIADLEAAQRLTKAGDTEADDFGAWLEDLKSRQGSDKGFLGLDTGINHLNNVISGLTEGQLILIGAPPGTGKTTLVKMMADRVIDLNEDAACLFVSLEQSKEELRIKSLARLSGVENRDIRHGRLQPNDPSNAWKRVEEAGEDYQRIADRLIIIEGDRYTSPERIRLEAIQARQRTKAARLVVFVDYLQIVPTEDDFRDIRIKVDFVTSELRRIARDLKVTVVALSSVGRAVYDAKSGRLDAFKESGGVEFGSDVAIVMVEDRREESGDRSGSSPYKGLDRRWKRVFLDVVKNRNGERARIDMKYFPEVDYFEEGGKSSLPDD